MGGKSFTHPGLRKLPITQAAVGDLQAISYDIAKAMGIKHTGTEQQ